MRSLILAAALLVPSVALAAPLPVPPKPPAQTLAQACGHKPHPAPAGLLAQACGQLHQDAVVVKVLSQRLTAAESDAIGWQIRATGTP